MISIYKLNERVVIMKSLIVKQVMCFTHMTDCLLISTHRKIISLTVESFSVASGIKSSGVWLVVHYSP